MSGLEFISTLITHALWPLVVIAAIIVFRRPLKELLGRIRSYEGLGQKIKFGEELARAEDSVSEAVASTSVDRESALFPETAHDKLALEAEANPSYVLLQAWEELAAALSDLLGTMGMTLRTGTLQRDLRRLQRKYEQHDIEGFFAPAVLDLRNLRDHVAHGEHNPTPGEALAYARAAGALRDTAESILLSSDA